uniref:Uncharacterized protein n=1 Tax=virus sp. ctx9V1 TaxID=2828001 RepID=A0A8S5RDJ4_9VIRU|nr:MAG TPA: hypothetical protein [virus sp. ctx9V1]
MLEQVRLIIPFGLSRSLLLRIWHSLQKQLVDTMVEI